MLRIYDLWFFNRELMRAINKVIIFFSIFLFPTAVSAEGLYAFKSARGVVTFTSRKPMGRNFWAFAPGRSVKIRSIPLSYRFSSKTSAKSSRYDNVISSLAQRYGVEAALVKAVMHAESSFNHRAKSGAGAAGLMQLMPATARRFGVSNIWSPLDNIVGGVKYLSWLNHEFQGNLMLVAAGYNAGENAVKKYGGIPPYSETKGYVSRVMFLRKLYKCDLSGKTGCGA